MVSLSTTFSKQRLTVLYDGHYVMTLRKNILFQFHHYDFCFVVKTKNEILSMQDAQFDYRDYVWIILTVVSPLGLLSQGHEKKQFFSLQEDFDKIIILFHQLRGPRYDHENFFFHLVTAFSTPWSIQKVLFSISSLTSLATLWSRRKRNLIFIAPLLRLCNDHEKIYAWLAMKKTKKKIVFFISQLRSLHFGHTEKYLLYSTLTCWINSKCRTTIKIWLTLIISFLKNFTRVTRYTSHL